MPRIKQKKEKNTRRVLEYLPLHIHISKYTSHNKCIVVKKRIRINKEIKDNILFPKRELKVSILKFGKYRNNKISFSNIAELKSLVLFLNKSIKDYEIMKEKPLRNLLKHIEFRPEGLLPEDYMS